MKRSRFWVVTVILLFASAVSLKAKSPELAYTTGEKLKFVVSYKSDVFFNVDVGTVTFSVSDDKINNRPTYKIEAVGATNKFFNTFYVLNDKYTTWIDKETGLPVKATADLSEGNYRFTSTYDYKWDQKRVITKFRNHKNPDYSTMEFPLEKGVMDGIALFYELRSTDMASFGKNEIRTLKLLLENKIKVLNYKFLGREELKVKGIGTVKTLKFTCEIASTSNETFQDGTSFYLWVTDDANKVPVYFESPIKIGSVRVRLDSWSELKDTVNSVLPK